jgi:hypothetical protein
MDLSLFILQTKCESAPGCPVLMGGTVAMFLLREN